MKDAVFALVVLLPFLFFIVWMWGYSFGYRDVKIENRRYKANCGAKCGSTGLGRGITLGQLSLKKKGGGSMKVTGEELNKCAGVASSVAVRIYNVIRAVGHGELTADNALHQLVEDIKNIRDLSESLLEMANSIPWEGEPE